MIGQRPRGGSLGRQRRQFEAYRLLIPKRSSKRLPAANVICRQFDRLRRLAGADPADADALVLEGFHDAIEAAVFLTEHILGGNPHIVECKLGGVGTKPSMLLELGCGYAGQRALDDEKRDAAAPSSGRIGARRHDEDVAIEGIGDEHLRAVDDPGIAVAARAGLQSRNIRAGTRLRHRDRAYRLAADDRRQIFLFLRRRAAKGDVHRRHVGMHKRGRGESAEGRPPKFLGEHHRRQRSHVGPAIFGRMAHAEKAERAHATKNLARYLAVAFPRLAVRDHFLLDETADLRPQHPQLLGKIRLFRKIKFGLELSSAVGWHDRHCRVLPELIPRCRLRNFPIASIASRDSESSSPNIWKTWII